MPSGHLGNYTSLTDVTRCISGCRELQSLTDPNRYRLRHGHGGNLACLLSHSDRHHVTVRCALENWNCMGEGPLETLRDLYEGESIRAYRFRYGLLYFNLATILYVVATSFTSHGGVIPIVDMGIGAFLLADVCARFAVSGHKMKFLVNPITVPDLIATASFLVSVGGGSAGFLRILRTLRLLHTYQLLDRLRVSPHKFLLYTCMLTDSQRP
jgi:hypothetical protein